MPPSVNSSWRLSNLSKRVLVAFSLITVLYILLGSERGRSRWAGQTDAGTAQNPQHDYADGLDRPLNITEWGLRGQRAKRLAQWATSLVNNPREDRKPFTDALLTQYPWLSDPENALYTPWASSTDRHQPPLSQIGIVVCAGSSNYQFAAHLVTSLRNVHKSHTPIEIAYAGDDDLKPEHRDFLHNIGTDVSFINLLERFPDARHDLVGSGWAMKPFALMASKYPRAILVDADAIFLTPPDQLFDTNPGLKKTGTLFFHDRAAVGGGDEKRSFIKTQLEAAQIPPSTYLQNESLFYSGLAWYEADSGVVCLDKSRPEVFFGLVFSMWMNTKEVRDPLTHPLFYGDKETFWIAMELSSAEYFFQPWYAGSMGTINGDDSLDLKLNSVEICGTHMLHLDRLGKTPFWINGGIYEHKERPESGYAKLTHYWVGETSDIRLSQPKWYWVNGNTGCLKETGVKVIDQQITGNLGRIITEAKNVDEAIRDSSK